MPGKATSSPATLTALAALWVSFCRYVGAGTPWFGCDNGKFLLERDLPSDTLFWSCPGSPWPEAIQGHPSISKLHDPEPASEVCLDERIFFNQTIPNSGAFRPVVAESGDYLYCPPQRWLNNVYRGGTVLLYHPCAHPHQRLLLSILASSCLRNYIITPHPGLSKNRPIALVSWGRTMEISIVATSDVCDWLETSSNLVSLSSDDHSIKYNLFLMRPAVQRNTHTWQKTKEPLRRCCERVLSIPLDSVMWATKQEERHRKSRAIIIEKQQDGKRESEREQTVSPISPLADAREIPSLVENMHSQNQSITSLHTALPMPKKSSLPDGSKARKLISESDAEAVYPQRVPAHADRYSNLSFGKAVSRDSGYNEHNVTLTPEATGGSRNLSALALSFKEQRTNVDKQSYDKGMKAQKKYFGQDKIKDNEVVDIKQREVNHKKTHSGTDTHHRDEHSDSNSSQVQFQSEPSVHQNPQSISYIPNTHACGDCGAKDRCDCSIKSGIQDEPAALSNTLLKTPRTDEAVWAAAALGFLLILLTLSVLHTRLYRHWRTAPSLYWHDPRQDYDSVEDVIRRRLLVTKKKRKRGRRQECVLLPSSSSSSDELY